MGRYRSPAIVGASIALLLPSIAIAWLGWQVIAQQREIDRDQAERDRQRIAAEIGADVRDRLNRIKAGEIGAARSATGSYSDPAIMLVAWSEAGQLALPWESPEPNTEPFRRAGNELRKIEDDVLMTTYTRKQPGQAAELLQAELRKQREPIQSDYLRILLAGKFNGWEGHKQEAYDLYAEILKLPSDTVDDSSKPQPLWYTYAADILIKEGVRERDVLDRVERDVYSFPALARWNATLRESLGRLRKSRDPAVAREAATDLEVLAQRLDRLEQLRQLPQAGALKAAFPLGVTAENWLSFGAADPWFIGMAPQSGTRSLVVAVRAEDIRKSVESERRARAAGPPFQFAVGGAVGEPMGDNLPRLRAVLGDPGPGGSPGGAKPALDMSLQQWFYVLSLVLVVILTFFGGHLMWRDTRRESRMAEMRSQFVSSVSHELKTPLTAIRMFAETLQMRGAADPVILTEYLDTIVNETERLTRLLNNVLDFSRIERGQRNYRLQTASLADVLRSVSRTMQFPLTEQGFELRVTVSDDVPPLPIDRDAIEQAVLNLLANAMKYSGESRAIELRLCADNGSALIQVADHGVGIPPEEQKRIFERFYRVPTPENRAIAGTGLGLALVAHIAEAHGGRVEVESVAGAGATFTLRLPIDAGAVRGDTNTVHEHSPMEDAS